MAYGLKYELWCNTRKGNLYKTKIWFDGYVGSQIDRNIPADQPFLLRKDKADVIRGTSFEFKIREQVDFEFLEFYTNSSKKIKVELYDPSSTLIWVGYNLPQQYQVPYTPSPINVSFTASDGLGLLKNEPFTLTGLNSLLTIIRHCIDKIGFGLDYSISINVYALLHDHDLSPLEQTYLFADIYDGMDCYKVLEDVLTCFNAEITQSGGKWAITRSADKKNTRMLYTSAGVFSTTEAAPAILFIGQKGETGVTVTPRGKLNFSIVPGRKEVTIKQDYGRKNSFLDNCDFSKFASGSFPYWTKTGSFNLEQRFDSAGTPYAYLDGYSNVFTDHIQQVIPVVNEPGQDFKIEIAFSPIGRFNYGNGSFASIRMNVLFLIYINTGSALWYLKIDGDSAIWTTTFTYIPCMITMASMAEIIWQKIILFTKEIPGSGNLTVRLHRHHPTYTINPGDEFVGTAFQNVAINFLNLGALPPTGIENHAVFSDSTEPNDPKTISTMASDAPEGVLNASSLYRNILRYSDGTPI